MRRWLANLIYPEGSHLRPYASWHDYTRGWNNCVNLWNETAAKRWAEECRCETCRDHRARPVSSRLKDWNDATD